MNDDMILNVSGRNPRHLMLVHSTGRISTTVLQQAFDRMHLLQVQVFNPIDTTQLADPHLWRNRLARSAVNRKVAGSSPARCVFFSFFAGANY